MRTFKLEVSPRAPICCVRADDLTLDECQVIRDIMRNNWTKSVDYILHRDCGACLQECELPSQENSKDGRILIEFYSNEERNIEVFVQHLHTRLAAGTRLTELVR